MEEALREEKRLRARARVLRDSKNKDIRMPAGVLLTRGIEDYASAKAREAAGSRSDDRRRGRSLSRLLGIRKSTGVADPLQASPRAPHEALKGHVPPGTQDAVPAPLRVNPPSKPQWPAPVEYRLLQLPAVIDFVMAVRVCVCACA
jgi:hypothetical protein